ncbi:MAG: transglutaminase domain-containing protein [Spirochaetales bacterium]|nr:transglutaminase domain-containing protein [Spirochaetales bacterium]
MPAILLIPLLVYYSLHFYLASTAPLWFPLLIVLPLLLRILELKTVPSQRVHSLMKTLRITLFLLLIIGFLLFILLLPEALYQAWLLLLDAGRAGGMISFAFAYAGGLVSSVGCAALMSWTNRKQALVNLLLLCSLVVLILYPSAPFFVLFLILILIKLILIQRDEPGKVSFLSMGILLLPALSAAFLFPLFNTEARGSPFVDRFSSGLQQIVVQYLPQLPLVFDIPGYGYAYDQVRKTGDRPVLSSNVIFSIEGEPGAVYYLRSEVFYLYSEGYWVSAQPGTGEPLSSVPTDAGLKNFALTLESDLYTRIPHNSWSAYYSMNGESYKTDALGSFYPPRGLPLSRGDRLILYDAPGGSPVPDEELLNRQLTVASRIPPDLKRELTDLAESLRGVDEKQSLANISSYLKENCRYSLDTESSDQMVIDFLFKTRTGYCVHFSTAAALLARTLGLPVRIAEGFLYQIPDPREDELYITQESYGITGYSAHQWPEVFHEDRGWIPWEVTPPFEDLGNSMIPESSISDEYTRVQLDRMGILISEEGMPQRSHGDRRILVFITGTGLAAVFLLFLIRKQESRVQRILRRKVRKAARKQGIPSPEHCGWIRWFEYQKGSPEGLSLLLRQTYSREKLDRQEKKALLKALRRL